MVCTCPINIRFGVKKNECLWVVRDSETAYVVFNKKIRKIGCVILYLVIKIYKKKKEGVSSRTISPPIADPPQVLVKIPIDWS